MIVSSAEFLIRQIKNKLRSTCLSDDDIEYDEEHDQIYSLHLNTMNDISMVVHEMFYFWKTECWWQSDSACCLELKTDSPYLFLIYFKKTEIPEKHFDVNSDDAYQYPKGWLQWRLFNQTHRRSVL